jgi:hypothetical protein
MNISAIASSTLAVGSIAWYYHMYGPSADAMTPAEEGYVESEEQDVDDWTRLSMRHNWNERIAFLDEH